MRADHSGQHSPPPRTLPPAGSRGALLAGRRFATHVRAFHASWWRCRGRWWSAGAIGLGKDRSAVPQLAATGLVDRRHVIAAVERPRGAPVLLEQLGDGVGPTERAGRDPAQP